MVNRFRETIDLVLGSARHGGFGVALIGGFALPFHGIRRATGDVDFLVAVEGIDTLVGDLIADGFTILHRSPDVVNLANDRPDRAPLDLLVAHRPAARAMLERAVPRPAASGALAVPVVDVEGIIGLKVQAMTNDPTRRRRDEDDIVELLSAALPSLDHALLREYFALFDAGDVLDRLLDEARQRRGR